MQRTGSVEALVAVVLVGALAVFPLVVTNPSTRNVVILILIYATLAQAWNILGGFTGQVSLGNAVFFGVGAYTSTLLFTRLGISPWLGMALGALAAVLLSQVIGYPVFRLGGHYFAIATIAIVEIALVVAISLDAIGGAKGLIVPFVRDASGRPANSLALMQFNVSKLPYHYIALALAVGVTASVWLLNRTKLGYYLKAIKNDQDAARALGVPVLRYKLIAIALSAAFTAIVGTFYAQYLLFIDPESTLTLALSVLIALIAILGGVGTVWGPILGAFVLIPMSEFTRSQIGGSGRAVDLLLYGALIMLIAVFQPTGLMGLGRRLAGRRQRPGDTRELPTVAEEKALEERPLV